MEELTGRLSQQGVIVRDGWLIGESTFTNYLRIGTADSTNYPLDGVLSSELNAELVFRGSSIEASPGSASQCLPARRSAPKSCGIASASKQ
ncbi:hypothetical protein NHF46_00655 [Arthrobacter alpinus]|nr:hypothetical protein [Arthrobacter alpinus]